MEHTSRIYSVYKRPLAERAPIVAEWVSGEMVGRVVRQMIDGDNIRPECARAMVDDLKGDHS